MKFKTIVCGLLLSVGWYHVAFAADDDDDGASTFSVDSLGVSAAQGAGRGREAWEKNPYFSTPLKRALGNFTYLRMPVEGELENSHFLYNTYPFDLPASDVDTGTLALTPETPFVNGAGALLPHIHEAMRAGTNQIMVTDFPNVSALSSLKNAFGDEDAGERVPFGFHFFGRLPHEMTEGGQYTRLAAIKELFDGWAQAGSLATCRHLDFAIASPGNVGTVDLRDHGQRTTVLNTIGDILNSPGLAELETLSLRFMHLTSDDLAYLTDQLLGENRLQFKRLILSFNDIDDSVMTEDRAIGQLIGATRRFPKLQVLDLRGNNFTNIATWDLVECLDDRREQLSRLHIRDTLLFQLSNHGFTAAELDNAPVRAKLAPFKRFINLKQPEGYMRGDTQHLKQSYDGRSYDDDHPLARKFLERWTLPEPAYEAIGDTLLVLRSGQNGGFTHMTLQNRKLKPDYALAFLSHAHERQPLSVLDLRQAYAEGAEHREETHRAIVDYMSTFTGLHRVSLSSNRSLGNIYTHYYGALLRKLPQLKAMTLSGVKFGSGSASVESRELTSQHFSSLRLRSHNVLRLLDYSGNILVDEDLSMAFTALGRSSTLGYVSLKGNRVALSGSMAEHGYGTSVVNFLRETKASRTPGNTCLYLDLTDNPITAPVAHEVAGAYQAGIADATSWPVLAIDGVNPDGTRTPVQYVSSARGLLELAQAYDCEHLATTARAEAPVAATWVDAFEDGSADKIAPAYEEAVHEQSRVRIHAIYAALQAEPVAALDPATLPVALGDYLAKARGILATYKVDGTDAHVAARAKLLKYADDNRAAMALAQGARGVAARKALFKSLTEREQQHRIYNQLSSLATQDGPAITDDAVIERVLAALV